MKPALVIIDMQKYWINDLKTIYPDKSIGIENINKMKKAFNDKNFPVIFVNMEHKKDGSTLMFDAKKIWMTEGSCEVEIIDELQCLPCDYVIKKTRYSAFIRTNLTKLLNELSVNELIITGFQLGACINATMMDAYQLDLRHYVISDACFGTSQEEVNKYLQMYRDVKNTKSTSNILNMLNDKNLKSLCQNCMN